MSTNLFNLFKDLLPTDPLVVGTIKELYAEKCRIELLGGGEVIVFHNRIGVAGSRVFVKGDSIHALAPQLTTEIIDI